MAGPAGSTELTNSSDNCSQAVFRASEPLATYGMDETTQGRELVRCSLD